MNLFKNVDLLLKISPIFQQSIKLWSNTSQLASVQFLTRMRIVDNSQLAKEGMAWRRMPRIMHVYNKKKMGNIGDRILLVVKGQKQKAIIVGCKNDRRSFAQGPNFDTNNCVLVDDQNTPLGTRITVPIPSSLRSNPNCAKIVAIATKFI